MTDRELPEDNPLRNYSDPMADLRNSLKTLQENPEHVKFERLCHEVFIQSKSGQELYEMLEKKYLIDIEARPDHPQAPYIALYQEGFRSAIKGLKASAKRHEQRIKYGQPTT